MMKKMMTLLAVAVSGAILFGFVVVRQYYDGYYFVLSPIDQANDPEFLVYQVDSDNKIIYGHNVERVHDNDDRYDVALLVSNRDKVVFRMASVGRTCRSLPQVVLSVPFSIAQKCNNKLLWPRDWLVGVPLGDGVKGNPEDSYYFGSDGVDMVYSSPYRKYALHVKL